MNNEVKYILYAVAVLIALIIVLALSEKYMGSNKDTNVSIEDNKEIVNKTNENLNKENTNLSSTNTPSTTSRESEQVNKDQVKINKMTNALIKTNYGDIEIELYNEATPKTALNFITLASSNFYDGVRFHRVIKDFMIQTGDPLSKDLKNKSTWGTGGPGYKFEDELKGDEKYPIGTVAMANAGANTNGSQFFIVTANPGYPLPANYTVFGKVTKGLDVAMKIQEVAVDGTDKPLEDVIIERVVIIK